MKRNNPPVDAIRIASDIDALAAITEPGRPWTRRAFTPTFLEGRAWLRSRMEAAGLAVRLDAAGNMIGLRRGRRPELGTLMLGSHSDTVPDGGRFDGIAGVIAGLEVVRALSDAGIALEHDLELVDFLAEEVSIFGVSCIGSRGMTGQLPDEWLARRFDERSLAAAIEEIGGAPQALEPRKDIAAFLELHIEQGPVLETSGEAIGVVTAIAGITRIEIVVDGRPDHAGTTPMTHRADALVAAAGLVIAIRRKAELLAAGPAHFTATVGEFDIAPGAANVVPGYARLLVDARASERETMAGFLDWLSAQVVDAGATMQVISDNPPAPTSGWLCDRLDEAASSLELPVRRMVSGAGHDTAWMSTVATAAMIFVPCAGGRSHCPEEWAEAADIARGASVLFATIQELDRQPRTQTATPKHQD